MLEIYPFDEDCIATDIAIDPIFEIDCHGANSEWRVAKICHQCFHKTEPDMWINEKIWESLNPTTHFNELPEM